MCEWSNLNLAKQIFIKLFTNKIRSFIKSDFMKRGRPNIRSQIQPKILEILSKNNIPMNVSTICSYLSSEMKRPISWNTVKKYLDELVRLDKVQAIPLPHSKEENKTGLTVYSIKR
jgi:hypothetical protein